MRVLRPEEVPSVLRTLRRPAELRLGDEIVGGVEELDLSGHDDARVRWNWWYDAKLIEREE